MTDGDWRLMGQQAWLTGRTLRFTDWARSRPGWDHDHCALCYAEIATNETATNETATNEIATNETDHVQFTGGYVTVDDNYTWICAPCFEDFKADFRWTVVVNDTPGWDV